MTEWHDVGYNEINFCFNIILNQPLLYCKSSKCKTILQKSNLNRTNHRGKGQINNLTRTFNFCNQGERNKMICCKRFNYIGSVQGAVKCVYQVACIKEIRINFYDSLTPVPAFNPVTCCRIECKLGNWTCLNRKNKWL